MQQVAKTYGIKFVICMVFFWKYIMYHLEECWYYFFPLMYNNILSCTFYTNRVKISHSFLVPHGKEIHLSTILDLVKLTPRELNDHCRLEIVYLLPDGKLRTLIYKLTLDDIRSEAPVTNDILFNTYKVQPNPNFTKYYKVIADDISVTDMVNSVIAYSRFSRLNSIPLYYIFPTHGPEHLLLVDNCFDEITMNDPEYNTFISIV